MESIHQQLQNLNNITGRILLELKEKELSVSAIRQMMDRREQCIEKLHRISRTFQGKPVPSGKRAAFETLFDEFIHQNSKLRKALRETLQHQQKRLNQTSKSRQAIKTYHKTSDKPDISFF